MAPISVRYIVDDVDATIAFYTQHLDFIVKAHPAPGFAVLQRGDLNLLVNATNGQGGAVQAMPDGRKPEPGGKQILLDDPAGNPIELFEPPSKIQSAKISERSINK